MASKRSVNWAIAYACLAVRLGETLTVALNDTPLLRVLEENVCRVYYHQHDPSVIAIDGSILEGPCKTAGVQSRLADINGVSAVLVLIPTLLAAIPYIAQGPIENKRRVLVMNSIGTLAANIYTAVILYFYNIFDPRWTWLVGLFSFIGGGDLVFYSLIQALIAKSIAGDSLSMFYIYTTAIALIVKLAGSACSLWMMGQSNWLPVFLSVFIKSLSIPIIILFVSDTSQSKLNAFHSVPQDDDEAYELGPAIDLEEGDEDKTAEEEMKEETKQGPIRLAFSWSPVFGKNGLLWQCRWPIAVFTFQEAGSSAHTIMPYWLSKRFEWTLQEVGWVQLGETLFTAFIVSLLPHISKRLQRAKSSIERDLDLSKLCLGLLTIGHALLGISWYKFSAVVSLSVLVGGAAFRDAYLGYLTATLKTEEIANIYMLLSMISYAAYAVSAALIFGAYSLCLKSSNLWATSLPMWTSTLAFLIAWRYIGR